MTTPATIPSVAGTNPLRGLLEYGQSPWMDYIRRDLLTRSEERRVGKEC